MTSMTDNRTTDETILLPCPFCGGEAETCHVTQLWEPRDTYWVKCKNCRISGTHHTTEAAAITAWNTRVELGSERIAELEAENERLRKAGYEIGYHDAMRAAKRGGTLTAEQVMMIAGKHQPDYCSDTHVCFDWQAIADELNAEMGSETCKITATATNNLMYPDYMTKWYELSCGHSLTLNCDEAPKWCAVCGKAVER